MRSFTTAGLCVLWRVGKLVLIFVGIECAATPGWASSGDGGRLHAFAAARTVCDGEGGFEWEWIEKPAYQVECFSAHEEDHVSWLQSFTPSACRGKARGSNPVLAQSGRAASECRAFHVSMECLQRSRFRHTSITEGELAFVFRNIKQHEVEIDRFCQDPGTLPAGGRQ